MMEELLPWEPQILLKEDDLQGLSNEEQVRNSWHGSGNIDEEMLKNGYRVMCVKWVSSTWQINIANTAAKHKGEEEGGRMGEIHTAMRRDLNSSRNQVIITNYF
jgi:hypothetical protein